jgi:two-component system sensor histidine kinase YesM
MMRYSLNLNSDLVRLSEEMDYIRDYLFILHLRHEERLSITVEEDPETGELAIAKFILQPLVENAVKYSLEKEGVARVSIIAEIQDNRLQLIVRDNGIGMKPELVSDLLDEIRKGDSAAILSSEGQSIGLRNVLSRCRLMYGEKFELSIHSELGEGTAITLLLPIVRS